MIRHTGAHRCPICGGFEAMPRGQGKRCAGFTSDDGAWVHCERGEHAGSLPLEGTEPPTYAHRLGGPCHCGQEHTPAPPAQNGRAHTSPLPARRIVATYPYRDAGGRLIYEVARTDPKGFIPRHPDSSGAMVTGLEGVTERVPYRLPELVADPTRAVLWPEGEKDCDRLKAEGLLATTTLGGAKSYRKHAAAYAEHFRGRRTVAVIPDNDDDGRAYATEVAASLVAVGAGVRLVELPGLPPKGDASDWLDAGHTPDELRRLVKAAPKWEPPASLDVARAAPDGLAPATEAQPRLAFTVQSPDELAAETAPEPLAGKWLAVGGFGAIYGAPGAGKSLLAADLSLSLASGIPWLDVPVIGMVPTLYVLGEGRLWLRMEAWRRGHPDADWGLFRSHDGFKFSDAAQVTALLDYIDHERPALVAFDTLATTIGGDENSSQDMGRVIDACLEVQRLTAYQTAVLLVCHPGKDGARGIRGHSSLEASLEVIARVTGVPSALDASEIGYGCATGGSVELTSRKNKEGARVEPLAATLHSGGLRPFLRPAAGPAKLSAGSLTMLRALAEAGGTMASHQWGSDSGLHRTQVWRLQHDLGERGYVAEDSTTGIVTLTDRGEAEL
jgi:AAA domain